MQQDMGTTNRITDLLNKKPLTIPELAGELGISRNSAHLQIRKLEAGGIVEKHEQRISGTAGKPAYAYRTTAGSEDVHSIAYKPVLEMLIQTMSADLAESERLAMFKKTGRSLAKASGLKPGPEVSTAIQKAVDAVNNLGAMAEHSVKGKYNYVTCHSCPVAALVHNEPMTCQLVAAFFAQASGKKVSVECKKDGTVVCGFKFT